MLSDTRKYVEPDELDDLFYEELVPDDHYLRQVLRVIDFARTREVLADCYSRGMGRPALEPTLLLKLEFLAFQYGLSDREVVAAAQVNMAYRYFLGLSRKSPLPHHTLLTHFRKRLGPDKHQQVFDDIVGQAREHGLVKDRLRLKDATHIIANIAIPSTIRLVAQTRAQLLESARPFAVERVAAEEAQAETLHVTTADASDKERLLQRVTHLQGIVSWVDELALPASADERAWERLQEALQLAHKVLADREEKASDKVVSVKDPDARKGKHGDFYNGYMLDVMTDADSEIITALNVLPANGDEAADAKTLLEHEEQTHGNDVEQLSIDSAGFRGSLLRELSDPQRLSLEVIVPPKREPETQVFSAADFMPAEGGEHVRCPAGQTSSRRERNRDDTATKFIFPRSTCAACPLQKQCVTELPKRKGRTVTKNDYEAEYRAARAKVGTATYEKVRRQHPAIERKLGELVRHHGARRARYRGQARVLVHGLMTAVVVNVKRMVRLLTAPALCAGSMESG